VDSLPEGPVKEALKARLDQVTTSEVTVNDADSNGKPDSQEAAEAAAEAAVKAAEDAAQAGKDKKAEVEADGVVELPSTGEINTHLSLFGIIVLLISTLMYGSKKKED
ncbi:LPXTG cell wall anchor domain-containing protein, partial [Streptococcus agalactiae]